MKTTQKWTLQLLATHLRDLESGKQGVALPPQTRNVLLRAAKELETAATAEAALQLRLDGVTAHRDRLKEDFQRQLEGGQWNTLARVQRIARQALEGTS